MMRTMSFLFFLWWLQDGIPLNGLYRQWFNRQWPTLKRLSTQWFKSLWLFHALSLLILLIFVGHPKNTTQYNKSPKPLIVSKSNS